MNGWTFIYHFCDIVSTLFLYLELFFYCAFGHSHKLCVKHSQVCVPDSGKFSHIDFDPNSVLFKKLKLMCSLYFHTFGYASDWVNKRANGRRRQSHRLYYTLCTAFNSAKYEQILSIDVKYILWTGQTHNYNK